MLCHSSNRSCGVSNYSNNRCPHSDAPPAIVVAPNRVAVGLVEPPVAPVVTLGQRGLCKRLTSLLLTRTGPKVTKTAAAWISKAHMTNSKVRLNHVSVTITRRTRRRNVSRQIAIRAAAKADGTSSRHLCLHHPHHHAQQLRTRRLRATAATGHHCGNALRRKLVCSLEPSSSSSSLCHSRRGAIVDAVNDEGRNSALRASQVVPAIGLQCHCGPSYGRSVRQAAERSHLPLRLPQQTCSSSWRRVGHYCRAMRASTS